MSTIKSSDEHLTLNADGNSKDIKFQANGVEKASIDSSGNLTVSGSVTADGLTVNPTTSAEISGAVSGTYILKLDNTHATSGNGLRIETPSTASNEYSLVVKSNNGSNNNLVVANNGDISFYEDTGTTAKLFWDASAESLGIGTDDPSVKLHINSGATDSGVKIESTDAKSFLLFGDNNTTNTPAIGCETDDFVVYTDWTEAMRISSGNVGIGVTPTAFTSRKSLDIGAGGKIWGHNSATETGLGNNFYYSGGYKYSTTQSASRHIQDGAGHSFDVAPSGSADSAISWTTAMTIANDGSINYGEHKHNVGAGVEVGEFYTRIAGTSFTDKFRINFDNTSWGCVTVDIRFPPNSSGNSSIWIQYTIKSHSTNSSASIYAKDISGEGTGYINWVQESAGNLKCQLKTQYVTDDASARITYQMNHRGNQSIWLEEL